MAEKKQAAPSTSAKSIIVNNRPIIKDPAKADNSLPVDATAPEDTGMKVEVKKRLSIKPLEDKAEAGATPEPEPEKTGDKPEDKPAEEPAALKPEDVKQAEETAAAQEAEHDKAIQKLVEDGKYILPINAVEKRRSRRFVMLGALLSLVLLLAWADVALDAGLIHIGSVKPVTHFFSN